MARFRALGDNEALTLMVCALRATKFNYKRFVEIMMLLIESGAFKLQPRQAQIDRSNSFDIGLDPDTARHRYRFTIDQLHRLRIALGLPESFKTIRGDVVSGLEAVALVCRRLCEPSRLFTVANEFGRSVPDSSRIIAATVHKIYTRFQNLLYFNVQLVEKYIDRYCSAVYMARAPLRTCWAFIDGTKHYISRPSPRGNPESVYENLQRSVYNGHPRRHCLNWQGVTTPDGIIVSMFGPVESRRHDSTMLAESRLLQRLETHPAKIFDGKCIYGDPAFGCSEYVCCPYPMSEPGSSEAAFNSDMSSVREAVEWSFGRLKNLWAFLQFDKKQRVRQSPIGKMWLVAVLLTNCHTCLQPEGNQISQPSLEEMLCLIN
jgi:hypothetical protein